MSKKLFLLVPLIFFQACVAQIVPKTMPNIETAAQQFKEYLPFIKAKKVALVVNQTSQVNGQHLLDLLLEKKVNVVKIFSPEHGFRGDADAGEKVTNAVDAKTGIPVISLYGDNKKPKKGQVEDVDVLL